MATISGTCTVSGSTVDGAVVFIIDDGDDTVAATTTSGADGTYSVSGLADGTYHVVAQYDDGSTTYNALSKPYITINTTIDRFEDNDIAEYSGDTGNFSTVQSPVQSGSYALQTSGWATNRITSTSGLDNYPSKPANWEWYVHCNNVDTDHSLSRHYYAWGDTNNYYWTETKWTSGDQYIELDGVVGGTGLSGTAQYINDFTLSANTWYRCELTWDDGSTYGGSDGEMTFVIHDADSTASHSTTLTDTGLSSGGIGWATDTADTITWDNCSLLD